MRAKGLPGLTGAKRGDDFDKRDATWAGFLSTYGFQYMDELDVELCKALDCGCVDPIGLERVAVELDNKLKAKQQDNTFTKAWDLYHDSFDDNADQVLDAIRDAFKQAVKTISPPNADSTIRLFRELGRNEQAEELLRYYIANRGEVRELWDLSTHPFASHVQDEAVRRAIAEKFASFGSDIDPVAALIRIGSNHGWTPDDIAAIAKLSAEDFVKVFKSHRGDQLTKILSAVFMFERLANPSTEMAEIPKRARQALRTISSESALNKMRAGKYGVVPTDATPQ